MREREKEGEIVKRRGREERSGGKRVDKECRRLSMQIIWIGNTKITTHHHHHHHIDRKV